MPSGSDVCGQCAEALRDKNGKFVKPILCQKCKKPFHANCAGVDSKKSSEKDFSWECSKCAGNNTPRVVDSGADKSSRLLRSKSTSSDQSEDKEGSKALLDELAGISQKLIGVKNAAKQMGNSLPDAAQICEKLDTLMDEVQDIRQTIREQNERIAELVENQVKLESENAKIRCDLKAVKISHELYKQRQLDGNIILSGLPTKKDLDPKAVIKKFCGKLGIKNEISMEANNAKIEMFTVRNNTVSHRVIKIAAANPILSGEIKIKYKEAIKRQNYIVASDLVDGADGKPIYMNSELTGYFQLIFKKARDLRRRKIVKFVWEKNGELLVRKEEGSKVIRVKHLDDLDEFLVQQ